MTQARDDFGVLETFTYGDGRVGKYHSLPALERAGVGKISRLPFCLRIVLESLLRNCDGQRVHEADVRRLAAWGPRAERTDEIPFLVARIVLQDFTGVPLLVDLAAMRSTVARMGRDPEIIEPLVPVDLVVDHSVQVDFAESATALARNMEIEFKRNQTRYRFLKWGTKAFNGFRVVPPGVGIVHQVNLEYLATGVRSSGDVFYPDSLVGTDSHTTMINGLGVVGWGVGGIEAEAGMLGQPIYLLTPDVLGVHLHGALAPGVTATDLVLSITERLRREKVVGKFVEFFGEGAASLTVTDRATIGNMAPEYGATMGYFPVDEQSCRYLETTGRTPEQVSAFRSYFTAQGMFGVPRRGEVDYSAELDFDLASVKPSLAGPKRPQDRIDLADVKARFLELLEAPSTRGGYAKSPSDSARRLKVVTSAPGDGPRARPRPGGGDQTSESVPVAAKSPTTTAHDTSTETETEMIQNRPTPDRVDDGPDRLSRVRDVELHHGDVVIAAITSCTNTSNPSVMLAAGLLAKNAVARGLSVKPAVKTSLAPGSRVVTEYLTKSGLQPHLDALGFHVVGYGCTTCIGNSGPLEPRIEEAIVENDLVMASVLSGNRNFEARVHQAVHANFLMSPPLVVAFALAGRVDIDLTREPLGHDKRGEPVFLKDIWPSEAEIEAARSAATDPATYVRIYADVEAHNPLWAAVDATSGQVYAWDETSTYIQEPPYFDRFAIELPARKAIASARALAIFGDSITTDHISPAGAIKPSSPAGTYLRDKGIPEVDFNTYGARRGNDQVMVRGTFANVRIRNRMVPGSEGSVTAHQPTGDVMSIYDASLRYKSTGTQLVVFAGKEYGTGSSRDWAAKGTRLLGVRAVIAQSFERIHRSNLVGMGVLPCQLLGDESAESLGITGTETFDLVGLEREVTPRQEVTLVVHRASGERAEVPLLLRVDTPVEAEYFAHGGILPYVLRQLLAADSRGASPL